MPLTYDPPATTDDKQIAQLDRAFALLANLPTAPNGRPLPPKTRNRARPARSTKTAGWGWTHYFMLQDGSTIVGHKLPGNPVFISRWITSKYGPGVLHLGRTTPNPQAGTFTFDEDIYPL